MVNRSTGKALFKVVYGRTPRLAVDLVALSKLPEASVAAEHLGERVKATQEGVPQHLEQSYAKYKKAANKGSRPKIFQEGDLVMVYLRKGRLSTGVSGKLRNKYGEYFPPEDSKLKSRMSYFQEGETNAGHAVDAGYAVPTKRNK
jgi:TPR repeat protein